MDINLTGPIAAQIAANMAQPSGDNTIETAVLGLVTAVIGAAGVLLGVYYTNKFNLNLEKWKLKVSTFQKKKDAWIKLIGKKPLIIQHYMTFGESKIKQKYFAKILKVQVLIESKGEFNPEDLYKDELNRWEEIENDVTNEIDSDKKDLNEIVGLFPMLSNLVNDLQNADNELNRVIKKIMDEIETVDPDNLKELKNKVEDGKANWGISVRGEFSAKIDNLMNGLREEMAKEGDPTS